MPNINSGKPWSTMDDWNLKNCLRQGNSIEDVAYFLCRDPNEVRTVRCTA